MEQGEIRWYRFNAPNKKRPILILTRTSAIPFLNAVTIAPITSTIRDIPTEIVLDQNDGMKGPCAISFDNLQTAPKNQIGGFIAKLSLEKRKQIKSAITFAFDLGK